MRRRRRERGESEHGSGIRHGTAGHDPWYLLWSGFGADWTRIFVVITGIGIWRRYSRRQRSLAGQGTSVDLETGDTFDNR